MREHPLKHIVHLQKQGKAVGIYSACTANELVLRACMQRAKETNSVLLIEATANQVDQYGGYTGMKPKDFMKFVENLAKIEGLSMDRIILGGDHLGPLTFVQYEEEKAVIPGKILNQYTDLEDQKKIAELFNTTLKISPLAEDRDKALNDIVRRVKEDSIEQQMNATNDILRWQDLIKEKANLAKLHISL